MKREDMTWAPGTSDLAAEHEGNPILITFIVTGKNPITGPEIKEIKIHAPFGWTVESLIMGLMYTVITVNKLTPIKIHCQSVELNGAKLN